MRKFLIVVAATALQTVSVVGCTTTARQTATTVANAVADFAPEGCNLIAAAGGTVCPMNVGNDVSDVAKLVADILASLPPAKKGMVTTSAQLPATFAYHGALVTLPADVAAQVWARLPHGT